MLVRFAEAKESLHLINRILHEMPEGAVRVAVPERAGEGMAVVESFRGEVLVWTRLAADGTVLRCHAHDPSWFQWPLLEAAIKPKYHSRALKFWADYRFDFNSDNPIPLPNDILVDGFFNRFTSEINSTFLRQLAANRATYWHYDAPIRFFYGLADQALHPVLAQRPLGPDGQSAGGTAVKNGSHRGTFLASLYGERDELAGQSNVLEWFDETCARHP